MCNHENKEFLKIRVRHGLRYEGFNRYQKDIHANMCRECAAKLIKQIERLLHENTATNTDVKR